MHTNSTEDGEAAHFVAGDLQRDPSGTSRELMMVKTQRLLFDVAEHIIQGFPETTYSDGKHASRLNYRVFRLSRTPPKE